MQLSLFQDQILAYRNKWGDTQPPLFARIPIQTEQPFTCPDCTDQYNKATCPTCGTPPRRNEPEPQPGPEWLSFGPDDGAARKAVKCTKCDDWRNVHVWIATSKGTPLEECNACGRLARRDAPPPFVLEDGYSGPYVNEDGSRDRVPTYAVGAELIAEMEAARQTYDTGMTYYEIQTDVHNDLGAIYNDAWRRHFGRCTPSTCHHPYGTMPMHVTLATDGGQTIFKGRMLYDPVGDAFLLEETPF